MNKKRRGRVVSIKEQIIEDIVTSLTLEFKSREDGETRLYLRGDILPFGNREFHFNQDGCYVGTGKWLKE